MDMDVHLQVLLQPPILYLVFVMIWWGVQFVPYSLGRHDHFMVATGAVLHVIVYAWLLHLSVPEEPWKNVILFSVVPVTIFTGGGYLLSYLQVQKRRKMLTVKRRERAYVGATRPGM